MDSLIGYLIAITLSTMSLGGFVVWSQQATSAIQNAAIAGQMRLLERGGEQYIQDNSAVLAATATPTVPVTITVAQLVAGGYVPSGTLPTNALQQTWQIQVLQPVPGSLQGILESTGGLAMSDPKRLVAVAALAGAEGGYVPYTNQLGNAGMTPANAYGSFGTWQTPLAGFTNPGSGHWASLLAFSNANTNNDYLYRIAVPGQPQLNSMQTDLGMTDQGGTPHNVNGANSYNVTGGGTFNSDQGGSLELGGNNSTAGTGTPYIDFHLGGQGVQDFNARIINTSDGALQVEAANGASTLSVQGYVNPGATAVAGGACASPGSVSADGTGILYSCVGGTWVPDGTPVGALGAGCTTPGEIGKTATGYGLVCTNGVWASVDSRMGAMSLAATYYVMGDGSSVPAPSCAGSTFPPRIIVTPAGWQATVALSWQFSATGAGGGWTVNMKDGSGNSLGSGAWAVANVYCRWE